MLAPDHKVNVVFRPKTVGHRRQEAVGVGWEVDTSRLRLEVENGTNEGGVLVRETIVLLTCPCRRLNIVQGANVLAPCRLMRLASSRHQNHSL